MEIGMSVGVLYQIKAQTNGLQGPSLDLAEPSRALWSGPCENNHKEHQAKAKSLAKQGLKVKRDKKATYWVRSGCNPRGQLHFKQRWNSSAKAGR